MPQTQTTSLPAAKPSATPSNHWESMTTSSSVKAIVAKLEARAPALRARASPARGSPTRRIRSSSKPATTAAVSPLCGWLSTTTISKVG